MIGAIIGDICGSVYEFRGNKDICVPLFPPGCDYTDDSILTIATAEAVLRKVPYRNAYVKFGRRYPDPMGGYGMRFGVWLEDLDQEPYGSWGNGSAMRVSPIGWAFSDLESVLREAQASAEVSHNHPEGIKGAQAVAACVWLARSEYSKVDIRAFVQQRFGYNLSRSTEEIRANYSFNESCQGTVPEAITAFLDSKDFEDATRLAISLGGDADTVGCITGSIAHAFYRSIPVYMLDKAYGLLPDELRAVLNEFELNFGCTVQRS